MEDAVRAEGERGPELLLRWLYLFRSKSARARERERERESSGLRKKKKKTSFDWGLVVRETDVLFQRKPFSYLALFWSHRHGHDLLRVAGLLESDGLLGFFVRKGGKRREKGDEKRLTVFFQRRQSIAIISKLNSSLTSSAISQNGFMDIRAPLRSIPLPSGLTRTRAV